MNELQNYNFSGQDVRIITINDEPWFVVADIAKVLGASNSRSLAQMVDDEDKGKQSLHSGSDATIVNESGLYTILLRSNNQQAKPFRRWVTSEVLPTIRKTGGYNQLDTSNLSPELQMFGLLHKSLAKQELATKQLETKVDNISNIVGINMQNYRKETTQLINRIAFKTGISHDTLINSIYSEVETRGGFDLTRRLRNAQTRQIENGYSKSAVKQLRKIDIIDQDERLKQIYISVVKEFAIKYSVV